MSRCRNDQGKYIQAQAHIGKKIECSNGPTISVLRACLRALVFLPASDFNILSSLCALVHAGESC